MEDFQLSEPLPESARGDADVERELEALRQRMMRDWWRICLALWLTVGLASLWWLRSDVQELREYFTWAAVRASIYFKRIPSVGLIACLATTFGLLVSESRQILFGLSRGERSRLLAQLNKIKEQGPSHPQWGVIQSAQTE